MRCPEASLGCTPGTAQSLTRGRRGRRGLPPLGAALALLVACVAAAALPRATAFYLEGVAPRTYMTGERVSVLANALSSSETLLPVAMGDVPYCVGEHASRATMNLGEILKGDDVVATPLEPVVGETVACAPVCTRELTGAEVTRLADLVRAGYVVNLVADNLPGAQLNLALHDPGEADSGNTIVVTGGFPLGFTVAGSRDAWDQTDEGTYLNTHWDLDFKVQAVDGGGVRIVGFFVRPSSGECSSTGGALSTQTYLDDGVVRLTPGQPATINFTYGVRWLPSDVPWSHRWEQYWTSTSDAELDVHTFSAINSAIVCAVLVGSLSVVLVRLLRSRSAARDYTVLPSGLPGRAADAELRGWEAIHADVFRPPSKPTLFAVCVAAGMQVASAAVAVMVLSVLGFLSPSNRGGIILASLLAFAGSGAVGGYNAVRVLKMFKSGRVEVAPRAPQPQADVTADDPRDGDSDEGSSTRLAIGVNADAEVKGDDDRWSHGTDRDPAAGESQSGTQRDHAESAATVSAAAADEPPPSRREHRASRLPGVSGPSVVRGFFLLGYGRVLAWVCAVPAALSALFLVEQLCVRVGAVGSTAMPTTLRVPPSAIASFLLVLLVVGVPMGALGAFLGYLRDAIRHPVATSPVPRQVPPATLRARWRQVATGVGALVLPFNAIFVEFYFVLVSITMRRYYYEFGYLALAMVHCAVTAAACGLAFTFYGMLRREDYRWWWPCFVAAGSTGVVTFLYCCSFLLTRLHTPLASAGAAVFLLGALATSVALFFACGALGYYATHLVLCKLYSLHALALPESVVAMSSAWERLFWPKAAAIVLGGFIVIMVAAAGVGEVVTTVV